MMAGFALVGFISIALAFGWFVGARDALAHQRIHEQIAADTRAAFIDDAAELAIDGDAESTGFLR